jgi:hypothetical protein
MSYLIESLRLIELEGTRKEVQREGRERERERIERELICLFHLCIYVSGLLLKLFVPLTPNSDLVLGGKLSKALREGRVEWI